MNKNNFDEFFREKFREFGEVPDEKVWEAISSSLGKRQKKRVIPIWWKLGGIAALLAVLFYIVNPFGERATPAVVNTEKTEKQPVEDQQLIPDNVVTDKAKDTQVVQKPESDQLEKSSAAADNAVETSRITSIDEQFKMKAENDNSKSNSHNPAVVNSADGQAATDSGKTIEIAENQKREENLNNTARTGELSALEKEGKNNNIPKGMGEDDNKAEEAATAIADNVEKKSIFDELDQEEEIVEESARTKWSVGPSVAPVYFSSFGEGSPIHSNFVPNSKSGNLNLSYGLSVSYTISKKLSVRSGIHKVDYGYDTNDIQFSSSLAASTNNRIDNIDYALTSKNLVVKSSASGQPGQDPSFAVSNEIAAPSPTRDGRMVQQFGYLEVPVELNYALVDSKFGVNIIGGVSSLFLVDNAVSLESNGAATDIGEANN
ncbi:MAG: hypothetical protein KJN76_09235, partial [Eudoraea sp.]|nr:hypothetical protein [Eudoraea sp.]